MPRRPRRSQASTSRQASRCVVPTDSGASTTSDSESSLGASPSHGFGPDEEPTREDLRSICVQVSHQMAEDEKKYGDILTKGWPVHRVTGSDEENEDADDADDEAREDAEAAAAMDATDGADFQVEVACEPMGRSARASVDDSETEPEVATGVSVSEIERDPPLFSAIGTRLVDDLEVLAATKTKPGTRIDRRKLKIDVHEIATDTVPRLIVALLKRLPSFPTQESYNRRPYIYKDFERRLMRQFADLYREIGEEAGVKEEVVMAGLKAFADSVLQRVAREGEGTEQQQQQQQEEEGGERQE